MSDEGSYSSSPKGKIYFYFRLFFSSYSTKDTATYLSKCPCETHLARTYAERVLLYPVDQLFELIFGNNSFTRAFHESQKLIGR